MQTLSTPVKQQTSYLFQTLVFIALKFHFLPFHLHGQQVSYDNANNKRFAKNKNHLVLKSASTRVCKHVNKYKPEFSPNLRGTVQILIET